MSGGGTMCKAVRAIAAAAEAHKKEERGLPERALQGAVLVLPGAVWPGFLARQPPAALVVLAALHAPVQQQLAGAGVGCDGYHLLPLRRSLNIDLQGRG